MTRKHTHSLFLAGAASALGLFGMLGCEPSMYDFRVYDDLAESTWAHASGSPEGVGEGDFGFAIAGGGQAPNAGASFLVAGRNVDGFGHMRYEGDGTAQSQALSVYTVNTLDPPVNTLPQPVAMVGDAASALVAVGMTNGGTPAAPEQATVGLVDSVTGQAQALFPLPGPDVVADMDFAATSVVGAGTRNLVLLRGNQIAIIADTADPANTALPVCVHDREFGLSVVGADLDSSRAGDEIAFSVSDGVAPSQVHIIDGALVSTADGLSVPPDLGPCFDLGRQPILSIDAPGGELDFGKRIVSADFNGNGIPGLAISSDELVYVYLDVDLGAGGLPTPLIMQPPQGPGGFGESLAAGDLTGDGAAELVVGAPNMPANGEASAGRAYLYQLIGSQFSEPAVLGDAQPATNQVFGRVVAMVPFGDGDRVIVVGAQDEIFTYFRTPYSGDVRAGQ